MDTHQVIPIGGEMPAAQGPSIVPIGGEMGGPAATFKTTNAKDAQGDAVVDPNTLGTFARHVWSQINPVNLGQLMPWPQSLGGSGKEHPLLRIVDDAMKVKAAADQAWENGDKVTASAKYVESLIPLLGPVMSNWGDQLQKGKYAAVAGDVVGLAGATKAMAAAPKATAAAAGADAGAIADAAKVGTGRAVQAVGSLVEKVGKGLEKPAKYYGVWELFHDPVKGTVAIVAPKVTQMAGRGLQRAGMTLSGDGLTGADITGLYRQGYSQQVVRSIRDQMREAKQATPPEKTAPSAAPPTPPARPVESTPPVAETPKPAVQQTKIKLSTEEFEAARQLVAQGYDPQDVLRSIVEHRKPAEQLAKAKGLPTNAAVTQAVKDRNATGRWSPDKP